LDDLLNLWDGIEENTGRILVISSNHYGKLDPALVRPGRIDISLEMKRVSRRVLADMFAHFYERPMDPAALHEIEEERYSPADVANAFFLHQHDAVAFVECLQKGNIVMKMDG
jgi:chaperone BCS1